LLEFGVKESWTQLLRIEAFLGLEWPLGFWKNGELFMENREGQLVYYDPFTKTVRKVEADGNDIDKCVLKVDAWLMCIYLHGLFVVCDL
jgi:hypothetical protein